MINNVHYIVDIKNGAHAKWHPIQLAGYAMCLDADYGPQRRANLYLDPSYPRGYKFESYEPRQHREHNAVFRCCLTIHNWRNR